MVSCQFAAFAYRSTVLRPQPRCRLPFQLPQGQGAGGRTRWGAGVDGGGELPDVVENEALLLRRVDGAVQGTSSHCGEHHGPQRGVGSHQPGRRRAEAGDPATERRLVDRVCC
ncbi:hypothetical protein ATE80_13835 [Streptomyces kanasensis]|uniref:Uncharacterized protein n=1 Tax=Streptomyces kanasensis TaxID=936756 RepID=A0A100Y5X1_9ACTN|nr:hypothetical protein ATE80_13835 [Streptomyces kanasensis]